MNERKSFTVCRVGDDRRAVDRVVDRWQVTCKDGKTNRRDMSCYEKKSIGLRESKVAGSVGLSERCQWCRHGVVDDNAKAVIVLDFGGSST